MPAILLPQPAVGVAVHTNRVACVFDCRNPSEVEGVLRYLELAHRRATQLVLCQELRLVVLHERQEPVTISAIAP
jgi:hypothetical protein